MKKILSKLFIFCSLMMVFMPVVEAREIYQIDPLHTFILYHINHIGFSDQTGKWSAKGTLELDEKNPRNSKVSATIDVANVITGVEELNKHLKGELFFHIAKYPVATFVSNHVEVTGQNTAKVTGLLTLRGVSKPITLDVTFNKKQKSPINDKMTVGFKATTQLKRSDFGMSALKPALGDDVKLEINVEANQPIIGA